MAEDHSEESWSRIKNSLKQRWGHLTEEELEAHRGNIDELVAEVQRRTGESQESIRQCLAEAARQAGDRFEHTMEAARQYAQQVAGSLRSGYSGSEQLVRQYPVATLLVAFGVGLGVGVALGSALAESLPRRRRVESIAERLGRQMLEAVTSALPDSLASRFMS